MALPAADPGGTRTELVSQAAIGVEAGFRAVRDVLLQWLGECAGTALPAAMLAGDSDAAAGIAHRTETVALPGTPYWAARQEQADPARGGRVWITEISLAGTAAQALKLGYRLSTLSQGARGGLVRAVPGFMRRVAERFVIAIDGVEVDARATDIDSEADVARLVALLLDPARRLAVIALSLPPPEEPERAPLIDVDRLAGDVLGGAYVYRLSRAAGFGLTNAVGKPLSVFNGAVRFWYPGLTRADAEPYGHPLYLPGRIAAENTARLQGEIVQRALQIGAVRRDAEALVPPFAEARRGAAELARAAAVQQGSSEADLLALFEAENQRLVIELREARAEHQDALDLADQLLADLRRERDDAWADNEVLRGRIAAYEQALPPGEGAAPILPDSFDGLREWAEAHLGDAVVLLPRCLRAAKKSVFENPPLAYQALLLMRDAYVPMRRDGGEALRGRWHQGLARLGLELSRSHSGTRAGENPDDYFAEYAGRRWELDQHLKGSNSRDPRFGFRLYFFWHEAERRVVVGSLPSHLTTRVT